MSLTTASTNKPNSVIEQTLITITAITEQTVFDMDIEEYSECCTQIQIY